jgi:uncharacterized protein YdeI (YjbR/CyaY-like superfamily)
MGALPRWVGVSLVPTHLIFLCSISTEAEESLDITKTLYVKDRNEWREWLVSNFTKEKEVWLIYPAKSSGKPRIPYNDAVEEALSFGWIDSTVKRNDDHSSAQRFSPRKPDSNYSQSNKERLKWLVTVGKLHPSMRKPVEKILKEEFVFPPDILNTIKKNNKAWENYQNFSLAYRRICIAYIDGARKRPDEFRKRLNNFIKKTEQNKLIGFGGIDKYY